MNSYIRSEFSKENVLKYAEVCYDIAITLYELSSKGYTDILIPSRGVTPIMWNVSKILYLDGVSCYDYKNIITLPFTADLSIDGDRDRIVTDIRKSWVHVYKGMTSKEGNDALKFFKYILRNIAQVRLHDLDSIDEAVSYYAPSKIFSTNPIFLDTVISGQSATTIIKEMRTNGLDPYALLIVDKNGAKLKSPYKEYLLQMKYENKAEIFKVPVLFTEDRGFSIIGITAIVYPDIFEEAAKLNCFKSNELNSIGAGIFIKPLVKGRTLGSTVTDIPPANMQEICHRAIDCMMDQAIRVIRKKNGALLWFETYEESVLTDSFEKAREDVISIIEREGLLEPEKTLEAYKYTLEGQAEIPAEVTVTSSHVIQVRFNEKQLFKIVRAFNTN